MPRVAERARNRFKLDQVQVAAKCFMFVQASASISIPRRDVSTDPQSRLKRVDRDFWDGILVEV